MEPKMSKTKAIAAGATGTVSAFLTALVVALGDSIVTQQEWVTIALATVTGGAAAFGVTWAAPANQPVE